MTDRKRRRTISSSSSSSIEAEETEESETETENDDGYDNDDEDEEFSEEEDENSESDNVDEENDSSNEDEDEDDETLCKRAICFLKEGKDLEPLSLRDCKAYLRKHGLRLAGTKAVCVQRIKEHWRIKHGNGESLYPRSSFVINCKGDVCMGDVVLFTQKVYEKFDKIRRHGNLLGKRIVAGRVVKESYGSAKQQHTFTVKLCSMVEVLWNKGIKKLPPLFPLLVKGRNLYKLKIFRQRWNNEAERLKVLAEKHERGRAARLMRATKKSKRQLCANGHSYGGLRHQKCSHHIRPSKSRKTAEPGKRKHANGRKKDTLQHGKVNNHREEVPPSRQLNLKRNCISDVDSGTTWRHLKRGDHNADMDPALHSHACIHQGLCPSRLELHHRSVPIHFSSHDMGSTSTMMKLPPLRPYADTVVMPARRHHGFNYRKETHHNHSNPSYNFEMRNLNHSSELIDGNRQFHQFFHGMEKNGRTKGFEHFRH